MVDNNMKSSDITGGSIFRGLPKEKLDEITRAVENRVIPRQTTVFRQGDPGDSFYIISSGKVRVFRKDSKGVETDLSILGPGDSFGEMALMTGEPRSANVETLEETQLKVLTKEHFDEVLRDFPDLSLAFVKEMRRWLLKDEKLLEMEAQQVHKASRLSWLDFLLIVGVSVLLAVVFNHSNPNGIALFPKVPDRSSIPTVSPSVALAEVQRGNALLIDAMPANFYEKRHIKGAVNMPLALFDIVYMILLSGEEKDKQVIVYGETLSKFYDLELADKLILRGHQNVGILQGGLSTWEEMGYPIEEKRKK